MLEQKKTAELEFYDTHEISEEDIQATKKQSEEIWEKELYSQVSFGEKELVLDVGCGMGFHSSIMKRKGAEVIATDFSKYWLKIAKQNNPEISFLISDVNFLPFKKGIFDKVLSVALLHHVGSQNKPISEFNRVIKRTGTVLVIDPNISNPLVKLLNIIQRNLTGLSIFEYHPNEKPYKIDYAIQLMEKNNLIVCKKSYFFGTRTIPKKAIWRIHWGIYCFNWFIFNRIAPSLAGDMFLIIATKELAAFS